MTVSSTNLSEVTSRLPKSLGCFEDATVRVVTVQQSSQPVKSASLWAVLVMASGSSSFQDRNQPLLSLATTAEMLVVCQTCCKEKRFLPAASLPVALSATSYLLFLSRIEQHSASLAPKVSVFLYLPCWQRMTEVAKPFKVGKREQRGGMMDGAGWKAVSGYLHLFAVVFRFRTSRL